MQQILLNEQELHSILQLIPYDVRSVITADDITYPIAAKFIMCKDEQDGILAPLVYVIFFDVSEAMSLLNVARGAERTEIERLGIEGYDYAESTDPAQIDKTASAVFEGQNKPDPGTESHGDIRRA